MDNVENVENIGIVRRAYPLILETDASTINQTTEVDNENAQIAQKICDLKSQLTSNASDVGDWKMCKCYEFSLLGLPMPYDIEELNQKRQAIRDEINALQAQLDAKSEAV